MGIPFLLFFFETMPSFVHATDEHCQNILVALHTEIPKGIPRTS